jgi:hypothetical protein
VVEYSELLSNSSKLCFGGVWAKIIHIQDLVGWASYHKYIFLVDTYLKLLDGSMHIS